MKCLVSGPSLIRTAPKLTIIVHVSETTVNRNKSLTCTVWLYLNDENSAYFKSCS